MNSVKHKEQRSPWRRLEARIKATQATEECSHWRAKEGKLPLPEGQKTAQQRLAPLADAHIKMYTGDSEAWRVNRMFSTEASTASCCQVTGAEDENGKPYERKRLCGCWIREQIRDQEPGATKEQILC